MSISKANKRFQKYSYTVIFPALLFSLAACQLQTKRQAELQAQSEEMFYESDLRAFCPQVKLAEGAYFYNIYGRGARSADNLIYQAAISDTTRDCRFDHKNGIVSMQIAAAGRIVAGNKGSDSALKLPINIKIIHDDEILFAKTYQQLITPQVSGGTTQFLFSEKVNLKEDKIVKGTEIYIGFDSTNKSVEKVKKPNQVTKTTSAQQDAPKKKIKTPKSSDFERLSPDSGSMMIPESW